MAQLYRSDNPFPVPDALTASRMLARLLPTKGKVSASEVFSNRASILTLINLVPSHRAPAAWFKGFLRRNGLHFLKVSSQTIERPPNHAEQDQAFRHLLLRVLNDRGARFVVNLDETAVQTTYLPKYKVTEMGQSRVAHKGPEQPKARITGVFLCGANGQMWPPAVITKGALCSLVKYKVEPRGVDHVLVRACAADPSSTSPAEEKEAPLPDGADPARPTGVLGSGTQPPPDSPGRRAAKVRCRSKKDFSAAMPAAASSQDADLQVDAASTSSSSTAAPPAAPPRPTPRSAAPPLSNKPSRRGRAAAAPLATARAAPGPRPHSPESAASAAGPGPAPRSHQPRAAKQGTH